MPCKAADTRWRRLALTVVTLYAAVVCAAAFEHHDVSCELKTPQHCVACTSTIVSSDPDILPVHAALLLADIGSAVAFDVQAESILLSVRSTGRSPPQGSAA